VDEPAAKNQEVNSKFAFVAYLDTTLLLVACPAIAQLLQHVGNAGITLCCKTATAAALRMCLVAHTAARRTH
jgi:hypothetical protein